MKERPRGDTAIKGIGFCPSLRHQDFNQVLNLVKIKANKKPRSLGVERWLRVKRMCYSCTEPEFFSQHPPCAVHNSL